jgi:predicted porin
VSPNFSGFTVTGAVIPGEQSGEVEISGTQIKENDRDSIDHWSVGAMYKGNGLKASLGYEYLVDQPTATFRTPGALTRAVNQKTFQAGASYTINNYSFGGQFQTTDNNGFIVDADYDAWALTGKATFGNNALSLIYTNSELDPRGSTDDVDTDGWGIGAEHNFSKRTKVYASYAANSVDNKKAGKEKDPDQDIFSLGMIHNF